MRGFFIVKKKTAFTFHVYLSWAKRKRLARTYNSGADLHLPSSNSSLKTNWNCSVDGKRTDRGHRPGRLSWSFPQHFPLNISTSKVTRALQKRLKMWGDWGRDGEAFVSLCPLVVSGITAALMQDLTQVCSVGLISGLAVCVLLSHLENCLLGTVWNPEIIFISHLHSRSGTAIRPAKRRA